MSERQEPTSEGKDPFLSLVAHEFRNPLTPAMGYLRMLLKGTGGTLTDAQQRLITEAHKSVARLSELTEQLSQLSLLQGGGARFKVEDVDVAALLESEVASVMEQNDRATTVTFRNQASNPIVQGDGARLRTAVNALVFSVLRELATTDGLVVSLRHTPPAEDSRLRLTIAGSDIVDTVESAAPGSLTPFDEFAAGLGFRLAIARRIVERHGGQLHAPPRGEAASAGTKAPPGVVMTLPDA